MSYLGLVRSEEHTSELQSHLNLVCRLLLEKQNINHRQAHTHSHSHTHTHPHAHTHRRIHPHTPRLPRTHSLTPSLTHTSHLIFFLMIRRPQKPTLFPYTPPFQ